MTVLVEFQVRVPVEGATIVLQGRQRPLAIAGTVELLADIEAMQDIVAVAIGGTLAGGKEVVPDIYRRLVAAPIATATLHARRIVGDELHRTERTQIVERLGLGIETGE